MRASESPGLVGGWPRAGTLLFLLSFAAFSHAIDHNLLFEPLNLTTGCAMLGLPKATVNICGYCVGEGTNLTEEYGKDCSGTCPNIKKNVGFSTKDCNGQCAGTAYVDECTGECVGGTTGKTEADFKSSRDCRGECIESGVNGFEVDACGICRKVQSNNTRSLFRDCADQCYAPGTFSKMGRMLCGKCIGGTTLINETDVLDECKNCKNAPNKSNDCTECKEEDLDICGVCHGNETTCLKISSVNPKVLPSKDGKKQGKRIKQYRPPLNKVMLRGAFYGQRENISCVFTPMEDPTQNETITRATNDTNPSCRVSLPAGHYKIGVKLNRGDNTVEQTSEHVLVVYNHHVSFENMTPVVSPYYSNTSKHIVLTFVGTHTENLPLDCLVTGKGWPKTKVKVIGSAPNTCNLPFPPTACKLTIFPTYDGFHKLHPKGFEFNFFAPPPKLSTAFLVEDGSALLVNFDRAVSLCQLGNTCPCSDVLLNETLEFIGWESTCKWATKLQLVIFVPRPLTSAVTLHFKSGVLFEDLQKPAVAATEDLSITAVARAATSDHQQSVALTGPSKVPVCGQFYLFGHYTSPRGGSATFSWAGSRQDRGPISPELKKALKETSDSTLALDTEWLEVMIPYIFIFEMTPALGTSAKATHQLIKMPYKAPIITAFSSALLAPGPIMPNKEVYLLREVVVPDCAASNSRTVAFWSTKDENVRFDFNKASDPVYRLDEGSLPEDSNVTFYATAFLGNRVNETTLAIITLNIGHITLSSSIIGNHERVVGSAMHVNSSDIMLKSMVLANRSTPIRYKWSCQDQDGHPCYNYSPLGNTSLLLDRINQTTEQLTFRSQQLKAGQKLTFSLQAFHAQNPNIFSKPSTTIVHVVPGNIPQVVINKVSYRGYVLREPTIPGSYQVPATAAVAVDALVKGYHGKDRKFGKWAWEVKGLTQSISIANSERKTHLLLPEGTTVAHGVYEISLSVCNGKLSICNNASITLFASPGVSACKLSVDAYTELDMTEARVFGCSIPLERAPIVYQLFLVFPDGKGRTPITGPQFSNVFHFAGPPDQRGEGIEFLVQVCDTFSVCTMYNSGRVEVSTAMNINESVEALSEKARMTLIAGDPIRSLSLVGVAAMATNDSEIREQITYYARLAIFNLPLLPGQVALLYSSLQTLFDDRNENLIMKALDAIKSATRKSAGLKMVPPMEAINQAYALTTKLIQVFKNNLAILSKVSDVQETLVSTLATTVPLAQRVELRPDEENGPVLFLYHTYFNTEAFQLRYHKHDKVVDVSVRFSQGVRDQVNIACKEGHGTCFQVAVVFELFPGESLFPEEKDERRVSPVVTINLFSPLSGEELHINEKEGITMFLRQTANQTKLAGRVTRCHMWDEAQRAWTMEPVNTLGTSDGRVQCISSSDGIFAAIEVSLGLSGGAIAGIIVATLMFVTIMGMIVMFFLRQKKANKAAARNSNSTQALKEGDQMNSIYPA